MLMQSTLRGARAAGVRGPTQFLVGDYLFVPLVDHLGM